ncbi:nucleotidyltransferase domain-containing protein [Candidatus Woesearchaeota archaeon]|nr:nucleotidyltransferase domain-containing protein [Candidatus Woesearchaeota archaeon]MCF7901770.1 nucleotidyltransferase domain-containing protein [Candidatus Woesearchaeota archaeon]MCF8013162.1 nucleotidyltransferase domain-containing protein [Candidatus Woesearchaeota archaeon]
MLKIFNDLKPFFEDNYKRIHVREYAKIIAITPPTASKLLEAYLSERILKKEVDKQYNYYFANKESSTFKDLQNIYWKMKLQPLIDYIENQIIQPNIILFGSIAKSELQENSDIDIAIFAQSKKDLNLLPFEKTLKRNIQLFIFKNLEEVPKELKNNILNGKIIGGSW